MSRDVICRVRALYAYESNDPSSLSFKPDAIIDVLAQLESGWWDGWCDGKRGWFPSNYVQILKEVDHHQEETERDLWGQYNDRQRITDQTLRLSLHREPTESGWVIQTTEDGSEQYYYNTITQEMRYSMPTEGFITEQDRVKLANIQQEPEYSHPQQQQQEYNYQQQNNSNVVPVRPVRAPNRATLQSDEISQYSIHPIPNSIIHGGYQQSQPQHQQQSQPQQQHQHQRFDSLIHQQQHEEEEELFQDQDILPPNWIRKMTPKGRFYYCNLITEETTWNLESIDPDTGILISSIPLQNTASNEIVENHVAAVKEFNQTDEISWQTMSTTIAQAVHELKQSIQEGKTIRFEQDTTNIVHKVRFLLYVTNCLDKETSTSLKIHKQLRNQHRSLLASLAKIVLSTKVASSAWPTPESLAKLQVDSDDVMIATRNFMICAQELNVEVKDSKPSLTYDTSELWHSFSIKNSGGISILGKSDVVTAANVLADNVKGAMASFMESIAEAFLPFENDDLQSTLVKLKANTPLLVAQFRNLSNTTSHFLNAIEEICQNNSNSALIIESKLPIYNAMGSLFVISQTMTSQDLDAYQLISTNQKLEECIHTIDQSIRQVCEVVQNQSVESHDASNVSIINGEAPIPTSQRQVGHTPTPSHPLMEDPIVFSDELDNDAIQKRIDVGLNSLLNTNNNRSSSSGNLLDSMDDLTSESSSLYSDLMNNMANRQPKDAKIAKFFGEDTIAAAKRRDTITTSNASVAMSAATATTTTNNTVATAPAPPTTTNNNVEVPWYLQSDIDPSEMIFNMEGNVKGGSLHQLVIRLTQHDQLDSKFNTTFLLTYRSFCTTAELFDKLFQRYQLSAPDELTLEELDDWKEKKLKLVRLRVFNVIKSWLETYFNDEEDKPILPEISHFTDHVIVESMKFGAEQLSKLIKKRMLSEDSGQIKKMKLNVRTADMPVPILPKNMKRIKFLELDPHELARQMTIMDFKLYNRIKPVECLDKNWGKPDTDVAHIAANVKASIEHSNQVTAWVTDSILSKDEIKKRAQVAKHWIFVAERCRLLNNYNTCMAILSAFDNGSIGRLKRTWELISARSMQILQNIRRLMGANRNFSEYRDIIHKINPPCIPFLGIYLQDLTFIEDGNSNFLKKSNNLINFAKRMKTAEVIRDLQQYQSAHYMLSAVPDIQEFIKTHLHSSREEEELYNLSLKLEPRERGEDTIARRLKESGL